MAECGTKNVRCAVPAAAGLLTTCDKRQLGVQLFDMITELQSSGESGPWVFCLGDECWNGWGGNGERGLS